MSIKCLEEHTVSINELRHQYRMRCSLQGPWQGRLRRGWGAEGGFPSCAPLPPTLSTSFLSDQGSHLALWLSEAPHCSISHNTSLLWFSSLVYLKGNNYVYLINLIRFMWGIRLVNLGKNTHKILQYKYTSCFKWYYRCYYYYLAFGALCSKITCLITVQIAISFSLIGQWFNYLTAEPYNNVWRMIIFKSTSGWWKEI